MLKLLKSELIQFSKELKTFDKKVVIVFLSSIILFTISWYFSNPKYFRETVIFINPIQPIIEELISFSYWFILDSLLFFIVPIYIIKLGFKESIKGYGLTFGNRKLGIVYLLIALVLASPIIIFASSSENFSSYFPLMQSAKDDFLVFLIYEVTFLVFIFSWEFIFRGFILFGLEKKFGLYAIFIQMIPFVLLHSGKPFIETFASIFGGLFLGYLALRTRSIMYGFLIHAFILVTLDILSFIRG